MSCSDLQMKMFASGCFLSLNRYFACFPWRFNCFDFCCVLVLDSIASKIQITVNCGEGLVL